MECWPRLCTCLAPLPHRGRCHEKGHQWHAHRSTELHAIPQHIQDHWMHDLIPVLHISELPRLALAKLTQLSWRVAVLLHDPHYGALDLCDRSKANGLLQRGMQFNDLLTARAEDLVNSLACNNSFLRNGFGLVQRLHVHRQQFLLKLRPHVALNIALFP